jgi:beta-1,4-mannosyltransferase
MLMQAQRELGWEVIDGGGGGNFRRTALRDWRPDVLHLHWLHPYLLRKGRLASWTRGLRFLAEIALLRSRGIKIVWTVHNLVNHNRHHDGIELALTRRFARQCDLILTHGEAAATAARAQFHIPDSVRILVVRHPNYCALDEDRPPSAYDHQHSASKNNGIVVGFLGRIEPYKQVVELVREFRACAGATDRLLIGGCGAADYAADIRLSINGDPRIEFRNEYVPNNQIGSFVRAADLIACPSRGILTSGSVILAMSFGRPVLAPAEGCIPEEVGDTGFLYDNSQTDGLQEVLQRAFAAKSLLPEMGRQALARAQEASPERIAEQIVAAYDSLLAQRRR